MELALYVTFFLLFLHASKRLYQGIKRGNHHKMKDFIIIMLIMIFIKVIHIIVQIIFLTTGTEKDRNFYDDHVTGTAHIAISCIGVLITCYFVLCIYSLKKNIQEDF
jgi:heme/copper-type cytochrome/quinol oxidase subunit 2